MPIHEGGHALTGLLTEDVDPVTKVTIVPRGQALGVTQYSPLDDRYNYSKEYLEAQLVTALGGRAAEEVAIGHITTGAENDLQTCHRHCAADGDPLGYERATGNDLV